MTIKPFPWKRGFRKVPAEVVQALEKFSSQFVQVAGIKRIPRTNIEAGLYAHVGLSLDNEGKAVVQPRNMPRADAGKWSHRNKFGWDIVLRDLPKIPKSFSFDAPNFGNAARNGTSIRVIQKDVYQRQVFEPRGLMVDTEIMTESSDTFVVKFSLNEILDRQYHRFERLLLWSVNVLQENTGVAGVYPAETTRQEFLGSIDLSWEVFPPGTAEEVIARLSRKPPRSSNAPDFEKNLRDRVEFFEKLNPVVYLRGQGGFGSYFGAQFAEDLVVFENLRYGNAIYVLYDDWENASKRSRLDLLQDSDAQFDRVMHVDDWQGRLAKLIRVKLRGKRWF